jgi:Tfp pilus assembly protein PilO
MISTNRLWMIGAVTATIILLVAGWFLGAQPFIAAAAAADSERAGIEAQNTAQQGEIARLTEENEDISTIQAQYKDLLASIPSSSGSAAFIQGLNGLAASSGVQVTGITVSDSQAYTVPASAAVVAAPTDGSTPAPESTSPPVAAVPIGSVAATSPLITPENFVGIKVGVDLKGGYPQVLSFVKGLQSGQRLVLVTGFTSTTNVDEAGVVTAHIDGMIYVIKQPK